MSRQRRDYPTMHKVSENPQMGTFRTYDFDGAGVKPLPQLEADLPMAENLPKSPFCKGGLFRIPPFLKGGIKGD